jgi:hypothetical protein
MTSGGAIERKAQRFQRMRNGTVIVGPHRMSMLLLLLGFLAGGIAIMVATATFAFAPELKGWKTRLVTDSSPRAPRRAA